MTTIDLEISSPRFAAKPDDPSYVDEIGMEFSKIVAGQVAPTRAGAISAPSLEPVVDFDIGAAP